LRTIGRVLAVVVGSVAVVAAVAVLRLMAGPVELEFLHDHAQREFDTEGGKVRITSGKVMLEWPGLGQPIRLVAHDIKAIDPSGAMLASAPSVALSFEARSVLAGQFAPTVVVIQKPVLDADIRKGGLLRALLNQQEAQPEARVAALVIDQLLAEPNNQNLLGQLDTVLVEGARVTLRDSTTGLAWTAPDAKARLKRDTNGVVINADARFASADGEPVVVSVAGNYSRDRSHVSLETRLEGLQVSQFATALPDAAILRGIDLKLAAVMRVEASGTGEIHSFTADVVGNNGRLGLPGILPVVHAIPSVQARVVVDVRARALKTVRLLADIGAARVDVSGSGLLKDGEITFAGRAELDRLPVDRLGDYWPIAFAPGGREWTRRNVSGGQLDIASEFSLKGTVGALEALAMERVVANLAYRDLVVRYMPDMPPLENVRGTARYEGDALHFDVTSGHGAGLSVAGATIDISGLNDPGTQYATIKVPIAAKAPAVIEYLARPKLGLPKDLLYAPKRVSGDVKLEVALHFPLIDALALADLDVKVEADATGLGIVDVLGKVDLTDGKVHITYTGAELRTRGTAKLDGHNFELNWRELFGPRPTFRRRYELKGTAPTSLLPKAGLPDVEPSIAGPVGVNIAYQVATNGASEVQGRFDLKAAKTSLPPAGWIKEAGTDGQVTTTMRLGPGGKLTTVDFDGRGAGLAAKGQASFTSDNALQQISFQSLTLGRSDFSAEWRRAANGLEVAVRGRALEWSKVRQFLRQRDGAQPKPSGTPAAPAPAVRVAVTVALDQILVERGTLGGLNGRFEIVGERINVADLSMAGAGGSTFRIMPSGNGRTVKLNINNLGQVLKSAGWLDGLAGGWLTFDGRFDDSQKGAPLAGKLSAGKFSMVRVTPRANIGSLNTTISALDRAGDPLQVYEVLEGNIVKTGDVISLKGGRANGHSIGITAQGTIDLGHDTLKLRGIVVPSFALNNALSNIPLLGPLLTGGKDGGVFAMAYRLEGPIDDPKSMTNPMSAVTPGALRELFTGSGEQPDPNRMPNSEGTRAP
jgi:uncharacterized protein YhdP